MVAIVTELRKLGATVEEGRDYCVITPPKTVRPRGGGGMGGHWHHLCTPSCPGKCQEGGTSGDGADVIRLLNLCLSVALHAVPPCRLRAELPLTHTTTTAWPWPSH